MLKGRDIDFIAVMRRIEVMGGLYGYTGFHTGFGELLSNLLIKESFVRKDGKIIFRTSAFVKRVMTAYMMGISDTTLDHAIRKILHKRINSVAKQTYIPYIYLFYAGYQSSKIGTNFIDVIEKALNATGEVDERQYLADRLLQQQFLHVILYGLALTQHTGIASTSPRDEPGLQKIKKTQQLIQKMINSS